MEIRSFLAFELPHEIKAIVADVSRDMGKFPLDVRWVRPGNIHLTLIFMGNVPSDHLAPLGKTIGDVCRRFGPFDISLRGVGIFGNRKNPRVIWTRLEGDTGRISLLRDTLQKSLMPFGIKEEMRPFKPHLTLGRFRKGARHTTYLDELLSEFEDLTSPACNLGELVLFKSDLRAAGPVYTRLDSWALAGRD